MKRLTLNSDDIYIESMTKVELKLRKITNYEPLNYTLFDSINVADSDDHELEVFNVIIKGDKLLQLVEELTRYYPMLTNRKGYMYFRTRDSEVSHYRVNDFFGWSKYGVYPPKSLGWNKLDIDTKNVVVDIVQNNRLLAEYKRKLEEKEKEMDEYKAEKEKELKDVRDDKWDFEKNKANAEENKANAFGAALQCLATFLEDFHHITIRKDLNLEKMLLNISDKEHIDSIKVLGGNDVTVSKISSTILQLVTEEFK